MAAAGGGHDHLAAAPCADPRQRQRGRRHRVGRQLHVEGQSPNLTSGEPCVNGDTRVEHVADVLDLGRERDEIADRVDVGRLLAQLGGLFPRLGLQVVGLLHQDPGHLRSHHAAAQQQQDRRADAVKLYRELAADVRSKEGSAAAYYVLEDTFEKGDMDKTEKAIFAYSEREPQAYWLAKAFILLGDVYVRKGDNFQARATYQSVADGYSPADDGIVDEAKERIAKLN